MLKQFLKDSAVYGLAAILARGVWILLLPLYTRALTPAEYGISDIISTLVTLMSIALPLQIEQGLVRYFPDARKEGEPTAYASSALWFVACICLVSTVVALPFAPQLAETFLESSSQYRMIVVALITFLAIVPFNLTIQLLRCQFQAVKYGIVYLTNIVVSIIASIVLVLVFHKGVMGVLLGTAGGYVIAGALALVFARRDYRAVFRRERLLEMLRFSLPLVPSSLGYYSTLYINRLVISAVMTLADVGLFGIAYRIVAIINLAMNALSSSLTPLVYQNYRNENTPAEMGRIFRLFIGFSLMLMVAISLFSHEIVYLITTPEYYAAARIIPLLSASAIFSGMYLFTFGLPIAKKTGLIATINSLSGLLNIGLNYLLIPRLGLMGAGLATCSSVFANFAVSMYYSQKFYPIQVKWTQVVAGFLLAYSVMGIGLVTTEVSIHNIVVKTLLVFSFVAAILALGLVKASEVQATLHFINKRLSRTGN